MINQDLEYQCKQLSDPHMLTWHVRKRLSESIRIFGSKDWYVMEEFKKKNYLERISDLMLGNKSAAFEISHRKDVERLKVFIDALFEVQGVAKVSVNQYEMCIVKADLFTWEEITPKIEEVLEKFLVTI